MTFAVEVAAAASLFLTLPPRSLKQNAFSALEEPCEVVVRRYVLHQPNRSGVDFDCLFHLFYRLMVVVRQRLLRLMMTQTLLLLLLVPRVRH